MVIGKVWQKRKKILQKINPVFLINNFAVFIKNWAG